MQASPLESVEALLGTVANHFSHELHLKKKNESFLSLNTVNTMASGVRCSKRLGADLSVDARCNKRYQMLYSNEEIAHLKAMCAKFSCLFHDVIPSSMPRVHGILRVGCAAILAVLTVSSCMHS